MPMPPPMTREMKLFDAKCHPSGTKCPARDCNSSAGPVPGNNKQKSRGGIDDDPMDCAYPAGDAAAWREPEATSRYRRTPRSRTEVPGRLAQSGRGRRLPLEPYTCRSTISALISAIALAGLRL